MAVWLITGCSSGFGEEFVYEILARGDKVIATGRNAATKLAHLNSTGAEIIDLDVTEPQEMVTAKVQQAIAIYGRIDVLVNNAGFVFSAFAEEATTEGLMTQFNTNFFGCTKMTTALLPHFRSRKAGIVAFMNSIYSRIADPGVMPYAASKHALTAYATGLRKEVASFGIHVVEFDIGHFRTKAISSESMKHKVCEIEDYKPLFKALMASMPLMDGFQPGDVKKGVQRIVDVLKAEGYSKGRKLPERVPLGPDAIAIVRERCRADLAICDEWEDLVGSTDRDGPKEGAWAQGGDYIHT